MSSDFPFFPLTEEEQSRRSQILGEQAYELTLNYFELATQVNNFIHTVPSKSADTLYAFEILAENLAGNSLKKNAGTERKGLQHARDSLLTAMFHLEKDGQTGMMKQLDDIRLKLETGLTKIDSLPPSP
jgi:hypothetical protein